MREFSGPPGTPSSKSGAVLLVEDRPGLRAATADLLKSLDWRVTAVGDGETAALAITEQAFDLAVVNAYLEGESGLEAVDRLRSVAADLPVLLVSGFGDEPAIRSRVLAGDVAFAVMPMAADELRHRIAEALRLTELPKPTVGPVASESRFDRRWQWLAAAVVAGVAGWLTLPLGGPPPLPPPELDGSRRSTRIEVVEPEGELAGVPSRFSWQAVPETVRYRFVLLEVDGAPLWEAETLEPFVELPQDVTWGMHDSVTYVWRVEGLAEDFSQTGRSVLVSFWSRQPGHDRSTGDTE